MLALASCKSVKEFSAKLDEKTLDALIEDGDFERASKILDQALICPDLSEADRYVAAFETDKMQRILGEFNLTEDQVLEYVRKYIPDADAQAINRWVDAKVLEAKTINKERRFFRKAPGNLFLVDSACVAAREAVEGPETGTTGDFLKDYLPKVIADASKQQVSAKDIKAASYVDPVNMTIHVLMRVMPDAVPAGEVVRMWLPYPKERPCQKNIELKRVFTGCNSEYKDLELPAKGQGTFAADGYIISAPDAVRRSLYVEMVSTGKDTLKVGYDLSYTSFNQYFANLEEYIQPYDTSSLIYKTYTAERERHIVFTDKIKTLADSLTAGVTEPYEKVKRIWCWITENIPWAGARDYSTIPNIPMYVLDINHGDCGQVSLLFMTMARYEGIPARWQSGWMVHPGHVNLHDWAEVYYEGVGWVPVDQSFGYSGGDRDKATDASELTPEKKMLKFFFSRGLDAYRLIVNDDYGAWAPLYPAKIYPHNDEVDFQMGEVEWRGGNVLNGGWRCWMDVDYN